MLHGRAAEIATIEQLLVSAFRQRSGVLVLTGEAGIGKTALLSFAAQRADTMQVLRVVGVDSETELAFAGLHQLLWPLHERIDALPPPQALALRGALGLAAAPAGGPNPFLVAVATLTLLAEAAEQAPVLCLIDDAHWLDASSADALMFVARRLDAEGIVMLFAAREAEGHRFSPSGVPLHHMGGLDTDAAAALLAESPVGPLASDVVEALVVRTGGNPLALVEIPPLLEPTHRSGSSALPSALPVGASIMHTFLTRVRQLPSPTQTMLEVIAADGSGDLATLLSVAAQYDIDDQALSAAESAGLISVRDGRVIFEHPLMRAAVYQGAPLHRRRAAHRALADAPGVTADRRAWHLAAAAGGTDEAAAAALENTADEARARSGHAAAAAALVRAAELSPSEEARVRRLVLAADSEWSGGHPERARMLVERAAPDARTAHAQATIARLRGLFQLRAGVPAEGADILVSGADLAVGHDPGLALEMLMAAVDAAHFAGQPDRIRDFARRAEDISIPDDDRARFAAHYLRGMSFVLQGDLGRGVPLLDAASGLAEGLDDPIHLLYAAATGLYSGRGDTEQRVPRAVDRARALSMVGDLPHALLYAALGAATAGYVDRAGPQAAEGLQIARETGQETLACALLAALAKVAALRGDEEECRARAAESLAVALPRRLGLAAALATEALGLLDLGLGRPDDALARFQAIADAGPGAGHPFVAMTTATYLVEAAVRADRRDVADAAAAEFSARAEHAGPGQRAMAAYCRALVRAGSTGGIAGDASDQTAAQFEEALRLLTAPMPFWRARMELSYGEHLRRARERREARVHLRAALETFDWLGLAPWADRAGTELRATGETARRRTLFAVDKLTPQELQIVHFVSHGASNPEIAAQLFLSRRTVEYHLRKVFRKLNISSRAELMQLDRPIGALGGLDARVS